MSPSKKHSLLEVQNFIWDAINRPLTADWNMRKRWDGTSSTATIAEEFIAPSKTLSSFERLEIYNQQYWFRMLDCFEDDFPGLKAVLGEKRFRTLSYTYLQAHPSGSFSLRDLGSELPSFLESNVELVAPHTVLCLEMAKFEWAQIVAFDGPSLEPLSAKAFQGVPPERLRVRLQPYMTLLNLSHGLDEYSAALRKHDAERGEAGGSAPRSVRKTKAPWPVEEQVYLVVHRHENMVYFKRLDGPAFALLSALAQGMNLIDACSCAVAFCEEHLLDGVSPEQINSWFATWMRLKWLCPLPTE